ncbi:SDR family oxidoreductase [Parasporobacterium paucivorans]|uniref:NAD(P)-dependent dehydrogenase, short-chain alcohol dehydrogenase family n=1 Tax=Parasporobacterium paucivorans DSM 15970 TaxID=1122934 RepID=A0A1M6GLX2_9FIRM|nr:SDR family oxidoreductase [Parasporobacterium paucivorans]SHJ10912.1 NAD(P)-dependent dehydrogenase, short-chain alcohol dehydrogenase family [Parasporobacterium paucivorans DSM 15970]
MGRIENQVAVVTGAASGMGKAIAILFAKEGAKVVVADMKLEAAQAVVDEIVAAGGMALAVAANVTSEEDVQNMIDAAVSVYGTLDILVNNAGIMDNFEPVEAVTDERWQAIMEVNAMGPVRAMRKAIPIFKEKKHGVIVNIASAGGLHGSRAGVIYTASKHALVGVTRNVGFQYANLGIRCNAIAPGAVATNIGKSIYAPNQFGMERAFAGMNLNPRVGEAEEIAKAALFLASDEASFVNATTLVADGGWTAY